MNSLATTKLRSGYSNLDIKKLADEFATGRFEQGPGRRINMILTSLPPHDPRHRSARKQKNAYISRFRASEYERILKEAIERVEQDSAALRHNIEEQAADMKDIQMGILQYRNQLLVKHLLMAFVSSNNPNFSISSSSSPREQRFGEYDCKIQLNRKSAGSSSSWSSPISSSQIFPKEYSHVSELDEFVERSSQCSRDWCINDLSSIDQDGISCPEPEHLPVDAVENVTLDGSEESAEPDSMYKDDFCIDDIEDVMDIDMYFERDP